MVVHTMAGNVAFGQLQICKAGFRWPVGANQVSHPNCGGCGDSKWEADIDEGAECEEDGVGIHLSLTCVSKQETTVCTHSEHEVTGACACAKGGEKANSAGHWLLGQPKCRRWLDRPQHSQQTYTASYTCEHIKLYVPGATQHQAENFSPVILCGPIASPL